VLTVWLKKRDNGEDNNGRPLEVQTAIETMSDEDFDDIVEQLGIKRKLQGKS